MTPSCGPTLDLRHECAVAAVYDLAGDNPSQNGARRPFGLVTRMLLDMQTRGQLSAGVTAYLPGHAELLKTHKEVGPVDQVFGLSRPEISRRLTPTVDGVAMIGHCRYATTGGEDVRYAQPFERRHGRPWKWFSFAFNGTLSNYTDLRERLTRSKGYHFSLDTDTEVIEHYLAHALRGEDRPDLATVMRQLSAEFDGAYCLVFLDGAGRMLIARDPLGLRPLNWAVSDGIFAAASESAALANAGFRDIRPVTPGEAIIVDGGPPTIERFAEARPSHCFFEWVYFAHVASEIDGHGVYESRTRAGQILARLETIPADDNTIAVPVPDTAKAAADAFAYELRIPCVEGVFRNRFIGRTFIQGADSREEAVKRKYTPLPSVLRGKRVFLIEDSVVRSTTLKALVASIRRVCEPQELHLRVACPPIVAPCFYGIDMSTVSELFAARHLSGPATTGPTARILETMSTELGVDTLRYLGIDDLAAAIGIPAGQLCLGCVTSRYPTAGGNELYTRAVDRSMKRAGNARIYGAPESGRRTSS